MVKSKSKRIVITGGHHTPALPVIEELKKRGDFEFYWFGHQTSLHGEGTTSVEMKTVKKLGIPFYDLRAGKLYKTGFGEWVKIPLGFFRAFYFLLKVRPDLVFSFGGYLAAPVVLAAFILRIPSVTHEQTVASGWANQLVARFAKRVFVSWEQSLTHFPPKKTVLTGNPLRPVIFEKKTNRFRFRGDLPVVYITGGKQGAHVINEAVRAALSRFLEAYNVIHQTGSSEVFQDYQKLVLLRDQLPKNLQSHYIIQEYFGENEIGAVFASADIVVGRSGANTVSELAALGKPAVLIPIPWVSHQEQFKNAQLLADLGGAIILPQDRLTSAALYESIDQIASDFPRYRRLAAEAKEMVDLNAASKIAEEVTHLLNLG